MKLNYYQDTDSLYIDLSSGKSAESREISEGVVLDYDSKKLDFSELKILHVPGQVYIKN